MIFQKPRDAARSKALVDIMTWTVTTAQKYAGDLYYVPLPEGVQKAALQSLSQVGV